jgi:hypothetical protein
MHENIVESMFFGKRNAQRYEIEPRNLKREAIQKPIETLRREQANPMNL